MVDKFIAEASRFTERGFDINYYCIGSNIIGEYLSYSSQFLLNPKIEISLINTNFFWIIAAKTVILPSTALVRFVCEMDLLKWWAANSATESCWRQNVAALFPLINVVSEQLPRSIIMMMMQSFYLQFLVKSTFYLFLGIASFLSFVCPWKIAC